VGLAFSLYLAGQAANALRWWILLRSQKVTISYLQALQLIFAGAFASNFLPSTIGGDALPCIEVEIIGAGALVGVRHGAAARQAPSTTP